MEIDSRFGVRLGVELTAMPEKQALYGCDTHFQEGWEDIVAAAGPLADWIVQDHALLVIKPEAVVGRRMHVVLDWLADKGFALAGMEPFRLTPLAVRSMWFYQWNIASRERKDVCDLILTYAPSVLLMARKPEGVDVSASEHFARLKGSFDPSLQSYGELRHTLRTTSKLMTFVHSADEPADIARELSIALPQARRIPFVHDLLRRGEVGRQASRLCEQLYASTPIHSLSIDDALKGLALAVDRATAVQASELADCLSRIKAGTSTDWRGFLARCKNYNVALEHWDVAVLASHLLTFDVPGLRRLLPSARDQSDTGR